MEKQKIFCPGCGRVIFETRNYAYLERKCSKCKKLVVYDADMDRVVMKPVPIRSTSSGCRFW